MQLHGPIKKKYDKTPEKLVIFLHGVGADGEDLIELAEEFSTTIKNAVFLSPNAPFQYDMFPQGYQWFSLMNRDEDAMLSGIKKAIPILKSYIDENLTKYSLKFKDLILIGFSQGTMMALQLALREGEACAAVIGFSGAIVGAKDLNSSLKCKPPILMIHGKEDQVIPISTHLNSVKALNEMDLTIRDYVIDGLGHGISFECIKLANNFLKENLK